MNGDAVFIVLVVLVAPVFFFSLVVIGIGEARSVEGKKFTSVVLCKGPCARIILVAIDYWRRPESDTRLVGTVHGRFAAASDADFATMY